MASKLLSVGPFPQGMNNRLPDSQLKLSKEEGGGQLLRDAVNVDVTARGTLKRRAGATLAHAGLNCHSGWAPRGGAYMLYADAGDLFRLDFKPDGTAAREQIAAGYPRSMAQAFPFDPNLTPEPSRLEFLNRPGLWIAVLLVALACLTLTGCSSAEAQEPSASAADQRHAASSARACPPGQHVEWVDDATMQCLRYLP